MEHLIFYFGACLMGLASFVSMLAVYNSNKRVLGDLKNPSETKDKWLSGFVQEYQKLAKDNIEIHNPSVYVTKRMRGRKIALWNMRQIKGISWGTFILSFLLMGVEILLLRQQGGKADQFLVLGRELPLMSVAVFTGIGMGIVLLLCRLLIGNQSSGLCGKLPKRDCKNYLYGKCQNFRKQGKPGQQKKGKPDRREERKSGPADRTGNHGGRSHRQPLQPSAQ